MREEELRRTKVSRVKVALALLFGVLTVLLTACPGPNEVKPEIILSADKSNIIGSANVTLKVEVTKGVVDSVTFKGTKGAAIPPVTKANTAGDFVAVVSVAETTTFTAEAKGPAGTTTTPAAKAVTVTVTPSAETPVAPSQTFKTYKEVALLYGVTPTGFSATSTVTVQGIKGDVAAATDKTTAKGGKVSIVAGKDALAFNYRPATSFVGSDDSFEYTVSLNGKTATGKITVTVADLPVEIFKISTLGDLNSTVANQTVIVTKEIPCSTNPCVRLLEGQTLTGKVVTSDGITILSPTAGIKANIPNTREAGTASCGVKPRPNCLETVVIELADNTSVEHLQISGEGERYFVAIRGVTYEGSNILEGNITIGNVVIKNSNGKPIYFKCKDFPCSQSTQYGAYNLTIDKLRLESAFDTLVIGVPGRLTFKDSSIELKQPTVNNQDFGDNVGIDLEDLLSAPIEFNNVDVFMESPKKNLDDGGESYTAVPFAVTNRKSGSTTNLTVANCDITFGDPDINWSLSNVKTFKLEVFSGANISITSNSLNNTSQATGDDVERKGAGTIIGKIGGLE
jgi:hypothetical protein